MTSQTQVSPSETQLVPVFTSQIGGVSAYVCDARTLHAFLEVGRDFTNWIRARIAKYGFEEKQDFEVFAKTGENPQGGRPVTEYHLTLDMAKELSMVENNPKGREARRYFIAMERQALAAAGQHIAPPPTPARPAPLKDPWVAPIRAFLDARLTATAPKDREILFVPMNEVLVALDLDPETAGIARRQRVGHIAKSLGWRVLQVRRPDARLRGYRPGPKVLSLGASLPAPARAPALPPPPVDPAPLPSYPPGRSVAKDVVEIRMRALVTLRDGIIAGIEPLPDRDPPVDLRAQMRAAGSTLAFDLPPDLKTEVNRRAHALAHDAYQLIREHLERSIAYTSVCGQPPRLLESRAFAVVADATLDQALAPAHHTALAGLLGIAESMETIARENRAELAKALGRPPTLSGALPDTPAPTR